MRNDEIIYQKFAPRTTFWLLIKEEIFFGKFLVTSLYQKFGTNHIAMKYLVALPGKHIFTGLKTKPQINVPNGYHFLNDYL